MSVVNEKQSEKQSA